MHNWSDGSSRVKPATGVVYSTVVVIILPFDSAQVLKEDNAKIITRKFKKMNL